MTPLVAGRDFVLCVVLKGSELNITLSANLGEARNDKPCNFDEEKIAIGCYIQDCCIDLQTLEEIPQALEEIQEGIITRRDPTGGRT